LTRGTKTTRTESEPDLFVSDDENVVLPRVVELLDMVLVAVAEEDSDRVSPKPKRSQIQPLLEKMEDQERMKRHQEETNHFENSFFQLDVRLTGQTIRTFPTLETTGTRERLVSGLLRVDLLGNAGRTRLAVMLPRMGSAWEASRSGRLFEASSRDPWRETTDEDEGEVSIHAVREESVQSGLNAEDRKANAHLVCEDRSGSLDLPETHDALVEELAGKRRKMGWKLVRNAVADTNGSSETNLDALLLMRPHQGRELGIEDDVNYIVSPNDSTNRLALTSRSINVERRGKTYFLLYLAWWSRVGRFMTTAPSFFGSNLRVKMATYQHVDRLSIEPKKGRERREKDAQRLFLLGGRHSSRSRRRNSFRHRLLLRRTRSSRSRLLEWGRRGHHLVFLIFGCCSRPFGLERRGLNSISLLGRLREGGLEGRSGVDGSHGLEGRTRSSSERGGRCFGRGFGSGGCWTGAEAWAWREDGRGKRWENVSEKRDKTKGYMLTRQEPGKFNEKQG
jgi:hypothetical protein